MPDDFDLHAVRARQAQARHTAAQNLDQPYEPTPAERAIAITECDICDDDGYRGTRVCDHIDHSAAYRRGMALVRAQLARPATGTPKTPESGSDQRTAPATRIPDAT